MIEEIHNLYKLLLRNCFLFFYLTACLFVFGQQDSATSTITLAPVILESTKLNTPRKTLSQALTIYDFGDRQRYHQQLSLQEYLRQVPGLFTLNANNYAQDLRLSIRGFGSRAAFGIRGVKLVVDPLSLQYLSGAEVDFIDDLMGTRFVVNNPNAATTCGCGASFGI